LNIWYYVVRHFGAKTAFVRKETVMTNPMDSLYARLSKKGVTKAFARRLLPDWWDDSLAATPSALLQAQLIISSGMNFELRSLRDASAQIEFKAAHRKFKFSKAVDEPSIQLSAEYATGIAKLAIQAFKPSYFPPPPSALNIRNALLLNHKCIDLSALLDYCNRIGVPVLHMPDLPGKKMDAVAIRHHGRNAIVLCTKKVAPYLLFHLAHEIGHIALGHLGTDDGTLIDASITSDTVDADERAADSFAVQLLNGSDIRYTSKQKYMTAAKLAEAAVTYGQQNKIDPGHIILNFAHAAENFALANAALKCLPAVATDTGVVNKNLLAHIDLESLSDDQASLLTKALAAHA
jgi:hypothetical protein